MSGNIVFMVVPLFVIAAIVMAVLPVVTEIKKQSGKGTPNRSQNGKNRTYNREVDSIHITTDAATERRRRLDQLKSLYDAGMMEQDEFNERCADVEADFARGSTRYR